MKKILAIILASLMLLSLTACGNDENLRGETSGGEQAADTNTEEEKEFTLGTTSGATYKNEFLGIGADLGEGWTFYTDEQIKDLNKLSFDMVDEDIAKQLENAPLIYDMYASANEGADTLNLNIENIGLTNSTLISTETYLDNSMPTLKTALESMGFENVTAEKSTITFAGKTENCIKIHATVSGVDFYETLVCVKKGKYLVCVTAGSLVENRTEDHLSKFYALD